MRPEQGQSFEAIPPRRNDSTPTQRTVKRRRVIHQGPSGDLAEIRRQLAQEIAPFQPTKTPSDPEKPLNYITVRLALRAAHGLKRRVAVDPESQWKEYGFRSIAEIQSAQEQDFSDVRPQKKSFTEHIPHIIRDRWMFRKTVEFVPKIPEYTVYFLEQHPTNRLVDMKNHLDRRRNQDAIERSIGKAFDDVFKNKATWSRLETQMQLGIVGLSYFTGIPFPAPIGLPLHEAGKQVFNVLNKFPAVGNAVKTAVEKLPFFHWFVSQPYYWPFSMYLSASVNLYNTAKALLSGKLVKAAGYTVISALDYLGLGFIFNTLVCEIFSKRNNLLVEEGKLLIADREIAKQNEQSSHIRTRAQKTIRKKQHVYMQAGELSMMGSLHRRQQQLERLINGTPNILPNLEETSLQREKRLGLKETYKNVQEELSTLPKRGFIKRATLFLGEIEKRRRTLKNKSNVLENDMRTIRSQLELIPFLQNITKHADPSIGQLIHK